jgi:alginate O-acetyltransferase complex protein AlgI
MVFTTHIFVFYFLPVFLLVYFNLPYRWRNLWITGASYVFYGWWALPGPSNDWRFWPAS